MNSAIVVIQAQLDILGMRSDFNSIEEKANHIGHMNELDTAIKLLELCSKNGIHPGSIVHKLAETENQHFRYLVCHENESSNSNHWEEYRPPSNPLRLDGGDLVIIV